MNDTAQRIVAIILVLVLVIPLGWTILKIIDSRDVIEVVDGPFSMLGSRLHVTRTDQWYDLSPWIHLNGVVEVSSEPICHTLGPITYEFYLKDLQHPIMKFNQGEDQYQIYDQDGKVFAKRLTGWPFDRVKEVCVMPDSECFYTPIRLSGYEACVVLVSDTMPGNVDASNTFWFYQDDQWKQALFYQDSQTTDRIRGAVRRHPDPYMGNDPALGNAEFCCVNESSAMLYSAHFENGIVSLIPVKELSENWREDWMF